MQGDTVQKNHWQRMNQKISLSSVQKIYVIQHIFKFKSEIPILDLLVNRWCATLKLNGL